MHVDDPLVAEEVVSPHPLEQLAAREHTTGRASERDEQIELERAQLDGLTVSLDLAGVDVDHEPRRTRAAPRFGRLHHPAPQHRLHAGDELAGAEGLRHVVVGPDRQADELVDLLRTRREQDHRHLRSGAELTEHLEPVDSRHHHVEDHQIRMPILLDPDRGFAVARLGDLEPVALEIAAHDGANPIFVVDDEHALGHARSVGAGAQRGTECWRRQAEPSQRASRTPLGGLHRHGVVCVHQQTGSAEPAREGGTMQRRTAVAAASAISMSLLSGVVFVGAHLGALGFGSPAGRSHSDHPRSRDRPGPGREPEPADHHGERLQHPSQHEGARRRGALRVPSARDPGPPIEPTKRSTR